MSNEHERKEHMRTPTSSIVALVLILFLVACATETLTSDPQAVENPDVLFTEESLETAELELPESIDTAIDSEEVAIDLLDEELVLSNEVISSLNGESSGIQPQAAPTGVTGTVCVIQHHPTTVRPWRILQHYQSTDKRKYIYSTTRQIESVACSEDGNTVIFSLAINKRTTGIDYEVYKLTLNPRKIKRLTRTTTNETNVSVDASGTIVSWQSEFKTLASTHIRTYAGDGSFTERRLRSNYHSYLQPAVSANGHYVAVIRLLGSGRHAGKYQVLRYSLSERKFKGVLTSAYLLQHPSVTDDGNTVAWLQKTRNSNLFRTRNLMTRKITNLVGYRNGIEHPMITRDGQWVSYILNTTTNRSNVYARNTEDRTTIALFGARHPIKYSGGAWYRANLGNIITEAAINERFSLPLSYYGNEALKVTAGYGYKATLINTTATELVFDLQLDETARLRNDSDLAEVVVKTSSGKIVASQNYKLTAIYATPEVIVSIEGLTLAQFNNAISGTNYTVTSYNSLNKTALVNIGNEPSQEALTNLYDIIDTALPTQSASLQTQSLVSQIRVLSGPNYAYKPDGRSTRWLDPTCHIRNDLLSYSQNNNWGPVNNLAATTNAIAAHNKGFYGDDIVVVLLDSGVDANDDFDCPDTPQNDKHGTHIKNVIQAIAPNVTIVSKKVFNASGTATLDNLINTFDLLLAVKEVEQDYLLQGKKVILNMSFSAPIHSTQGHDMQVWSMLQELYDFYGDQLLIVTSSGNHGLDDDYKNEVFYPSGYARSFSTKVARGEIVFPPIPNIISVASAGLQSNQLKPVGYNPNNSAIDYLALGMNLCASNLNAATCTGDYLIGSSYATPVVSALAALNWDRCSQNTSGELRNILSAQSISISGSPIPLANYDESIGCNGSTIQNTYSLSISKSGSGTVNGTGISCGSDCNHTYNSGTSINLTATPASGYSFTGWSGACSGTGSCSISMTSNRSVTAKFLRVYSVLDTVTMRSGPGNVFSNIGSLTTGDRVHIACTARGTKHTDFGVTSNLWNKLDTGQWVSDVYIDTGTSNPIASTCSDYVSKPKGVNSWSNTNLRSGPSTAYSIVDPSPAPQGSTLYVECSQWGQTITGPVGDVTALWNKLTSGQWISDAHLNTGTAGAINGFCP